MYAVLLTLILATSADHVEETSGTYRGGIPKGYDAAKGPVVRTETTDEYLRQGQGYGGVFPYGARLFHGALRVKFGPMPQSCYSQRYGCYPGSSRTMHRYPAFHGWFYRRPHNYRNVFDYPWQAEMHEPTPLVPYHAGNQTTNRQLPSKQGLEGESLPPAVQIQPPRDQQRSLVQRRTRVQPIKQGAKPSSSGD